MSSDLLFYVDIIIPVGLGMLPLYIPFIFLTKRQTLKGPNFMTKKKVFTYDRDIICLPKSDGRSSNLPIPRSCTQLAKNGLIAKICLTSDMTGRYFRSVFRGPMDGSSTFLFDVLQPAGGHRESLTIPALSN